MGKWLIALGEDGIETYNLYVGDAPYSICFLAAAKSLGVPYTISLANRKYDLTFSRYKLILISDYLVESSLSCATSSEVLLVLVLSC